jgi:hypothetical protein
MTSSKNVHLPGRKWKLNARNMIYVIGGLALCIYMLIFFFHEIKKDERYWKHINKEHGH